MTFSTRPIAAVPASAAPPKLIRRQDLARAARQLPRPLVFTNGVFDVLHRGHVMCLARARELGATLMIGLNSDCSVRRLGKGPTRPVNSELDRAWVLDALACVDAIVLFDEDKPLSLMETVRPEFYVKGGDYDLASLEEARLMRQWGGRSRIVATLEGYSTTGWLETVRRLNDTADLDGAAR